MRYVDIHADGGPEQMYIAEGSRPKPQAGEVLIRVAAAGVNRPDVAQRMGHYPPPPDASPILGLEVAGEIVEVGEGVDDSWLGSHVCALVNGGGYAEYATAPLGQCLPVPANLTMEEAASLPETYFTVWTNIFDRAQFKAGESLLVHGGSSGIGSTAIQLARALGAAKIFATAGSEEKCDFCSGLGADRAINYRTEDFAEVIQQATDGQGIDVILDMVGGDYVQRNLKVAAMDGRIVNVAFLGGAKTTVNLMPIMLKRLVLTGSTLRPQSAAAKAAIRNSLRKQVWPLLEAGKIKPVIHARFPLDQVVDAHKLMESNQHMGKIVLTLGS